MIIDIIKFILSDLGKRKFSSFLTLFAISLGIFSVFVIVLLGEGFENSIEEQFASLGTNRLFISSAGGGFGSSSEAISDNEVRVLESQPYISKVYKNYLRSTQVEFSNQFVQKQLFGFEFDRDAFEDLAVEIEFGRYPRNNEEGVVVIGPIAAEELFDKEISIGSNLYVQDQKLKVIGITKELGNPEDDSTIYVNINELQEIFDAKETISFLYVLVDEGEDINLAKENVERLLENRLGEDSIEITTAEQFIEQFTTILSIVKLTLGGIAFVAIIVGALGIINTMYVIVTEKTKDIGIMKSIGATNETILMIYMIQAGTFGFLGAILVVILGSITVTLFESFAQGAGFSFLKVTSTSSAVFGLLAFGFIIGILAGFLPSWKASKLTIVDTLRK